MRVEGQFPGTGLLLFKDFSHPTKYHITVWRDDSRRWAEGTIWASIAAIDSSFNAGNVSLRLQTGEHVEIVVTSTDLFAAEASAEISVNTPMPGF